MPNWASNLRKYGESSESHANRMTQQSQFQSWEILKFYPPAYNDLSSQIVGPIFFLDLNWTVLSFWAQASKNSGWVSKESRKWPWSAWSGPCAAETDQPPAGDASRSGWRIMGKPRFCRLKHEWIAHIANTIHRFRNLSRNQVIMFLTSTVFGCLQGEAAQAI